MKKYLSFFTLRFSTGLQYRVAALAGLVTQFVWGGMLILAFSAFYRSDPDSFPMTFQATATYVWLQQALLILFQPWGFDNEIIESIKTGSVSYELCRPVSIYNMWYARTLAARVSGVVLRCFPVFIVALLLPKPYGMALPSDPVTYLWFFISLALGAMLSASLTAMVYMLNFFTVNADGLRATVAVLTDFLQGSVIPLPFMPDGVKGFLELLPFASTMNAPLRIFAEDITGGYIYRTVALQLFWLIAVTAAGKLIEIRAVRKTVAQGG